MKKKKTQSNIEDNNGIRISYHEKVWDERMKKLIKEIDEKRGDIKRWKDEMNRVKGVAAAIIIIEELLGSILYYFTK